MLSGQAVYLRSGTLMAMSTYWLGSSLSHADVACACALRFTREAHPDLYDQHRHPALEALARSCEALAEFAAAYQAITNVR